MVGDEIEICIVEIRGDKVRIGITCPQAISVHRMEVYNAIKNTPQTDANRKITHSTERLVRESADDKSNFGIE